MERRDVPVGQQQCGSLEAASLIQVCLIMNGRDLDDQCGRKHEAGDDKDGTEHAKGVRSTPNHVSSSM